MFNLAQGHLSAVPALSLSPDGWLLLSGGRDKVACVWDIRSGARLATVPVFEALEGGRRAVCGAVMATACSAWSVGRQLWAVEV